MCLVRGAGCSSVQAGGQLLSIRNRAFRRRYSQPERMLKSRLSEAQVGSPLPHLCRDLDHPWPHLQPTIVAAMALTAAKRGALSASASAPAALATPSKNAAGVVESSATPKRTPRAGTSQSPSAMASDPTASVVPASTTEAGSATSAPGLAADSEALAAGSFVMARFADGQYYPAAVAQPAQCGRVLVDWADGDDSDREARPSADLVACRIVGSRLARVAATIHSLWVLTAALP